MILILKLIFKLFAQTDLLAPPRRPLQILLEKIPPLRPSPGDDLCSSSRSSFPLLPPRRRLHLLLEILLPTPPPAMSSAPPRDPPSHSLTTTTKKRTQRRTKGVPCLLIMCST